MTIEECAMALKVSVKDVEALIYNHELQVKSICGKSRISVVALEEYINGFSSNSLLEIKRTVDEIASHIVRKIDVKITLKEILAQVLEFKRLSLSSNSFDWELGVAKHIEHHLGDYYIDEILPKDIQAFYNQVSVKEDQSRISRRFMIEIRQLLKHCFTYAVDNRYILSSPMTSSIIMPKVDDPDPHKRFMSYEEVSQLLNCVQGSVRYFTLCKLLVMSGLRIGEALGLYWDDIDVQHHRIHVRRAVVCDYYYIDGKKHERYIIGKTKTKWSRRSIPIPHEAILLLQEWRLHVAMDQKWTQRIQQKGNEHLVFPNQHGNLMNYSTLQDHFKKYLRAHGAGQLHASFHRLRHSFGSFLLEQGEELVVVSRLLGHKNIRITADIYVTVTEKLKEDCISRNVEVWQRLNQISLSQDAS